MIKNVINPSKEDLLQSTFNSFDISNRIIVITGANKGNGLALASGLKNIGAKIIRIDLSFDGHINSDDIEFDLSNLSEIKNIVNQIYKKHGRIDGLINNAGISVASINPYDDNKSYAKTLAVNLHAAFEMCSAICPIMSKQNSGSIINITSLGAELAFANNPAYQVSKAGLRQLTKAIAKDWGPSGVRANNICPGYIKTSMTSKSFEDKALHDQRKNHTLLKRWGVSSDLVGPAIFLLSDASSYITGSDIYVDGGWLSNSGL